MSEVWCAVLVLIVWVIGGWALVQTVQAVQINRTSLVEECGYLAYIARARILYGLYALYGFLYVRASAGAGSACYKRKPYISVTHILSVQNTSSLVIRLLHLARRWHRTVLRSAHLPGSGRWRCGAISRVLVASLSPGASSDHPDVPTALPRVVGSEQADLVRTLVSFCPNRSFHHSKLFHALSQELGDSPTLASKIFAA